ncbi:MAG: adhesin, partial [Mesorhizobium sp.]
MATQISGAGGTTTSFSNTPQAQGDVFNYTEDNVVIVSASQSIILLDVLANDLGGNAKTLYSIDDGTSASTATKQYAPIDLTTQDAQATGISAWEDIGGGVLIRINNGKVEMNLSGYLAQHGFTSLQALGAGDHINETFTYAIKLGNGTLSWASVSVNIQGTNDGATITAAPGADTTVVEAGGVANGTPGDPGAHGQLIISDVDAGQNHFQAPPSLQGMYGTFTFDATTGAWTYALNQALADPLTQGQNVTDTLTVTSADGTANYNIVVNITGTNDAAVLSADVRNLTETDAAADISSSGQLTISDVDSPATFVAQAGTVGTYGTFAIDAAGAWTYTASSAHNEFAAGTTYTDTFDVVSADGTHTSVAIDILGTADGPTAVGDTIITNLAGGSSVIVPEWALIANDPASAIDVSGVGSATGGSVSQLAGSGANGSVTFADTAPMGGTFTYTATDGTSAGAPALVTVSQDSVGTLDGTSGDNILVSSNGGATLVGGAGNDVLLGGSGNDTYQFGLADGTDIIADAGSGGDSIQIITTAPVDSTAIGTLNFERVSNDLVINVGSTEITIHDQYVGSGNVESIQFTNGGTVYGYALSTSAYRLQTSLSGGGTDDVIASTSAGQALTGGNGNDLLFGNGGDDSTINGGAGNDLIVGGTGNDTLTGGAGADTLAGGIGSDIFSYGAASESTPAGFDTITDFV